MPRAQLYVTQPVSVKQRYTADRKWTELMGYRGLLRMQVCPL